MADQFAVEDLTLEQLQAEVWYWRTDAAARLWFQMDAVSQTTARSRAGHEARRELRVAIETLSGALSGDYHQTCFVCGYSIRPGDAVINDVNEGEMHASCPSEEGGPQDMRPGDKVFMDPESIVIDEEHPEGGEAADKPDHLVAHEASRLYTTEQITEKLDAAGSLLKANGGA